MNYIELLFKFGTTLVNCMLINNRPIIGGKSFISKYITKKQKTIKSLIDGNVQPVIISMATKLHFYPQIHRWNIMENTLW